MTTLRLCVLIPHYEHAGAIGQLLERLEPHGLPCVLVDDGSGPDARAVLRELAARLPWVSVVWREHNGGQGAAKRSGYRAALEAGYTHLIEMDADGQHDTDDIPRFIEQLEADPQAVVFGKPLFGADAPRARIWGRQLSRGIVWLACGSTAVDDPLCGYRAMPVAAACQVEDSAPTGDRMNHDPAFAVRAFRAGHPIRNLPTRVSYPTDGVSHFDLLHDNLRLVSTYARLLAELPLALPSILVARRRAAEVAAQHARRDPARSQASPCP